MKSLQEMINAIIESGLSQTAVGKEVGTSQATINRIIHKDQIPSYDVGKAIERLYHQRVKKTKAA